MSKDEDLKQHQETSGKAPTPQGEGTASPNPAPNSTTSTTNIFDFRKQKSFDFGFEVNKQFITISAAIITVSVTFMSYTGNANNGEFIRSLLASWVLFSVSILTGFFSMQSIVGELSIKNEPSIYESKVRMFSSIQILTFITAIGFMIYFGYHSFIIAPASIPKP